MDDEDAEIKFLETESCSTKSDGLQSFGVASEMFKMDPVPISIVCNVCGESVSNTQDWLIHHFTDWHRRIIKWIDAFRSKCIERQDEEAESVFLGAIESVKGSISYTQELFEVQSRLFCCACACEVSDIAAHLDSLKHNEMVLSIVDSSAFVEIKNTCLKNDDRSIKEDLYNGEILKWLSQELPTTADSPLEVVVLRSDEQFNEWFTKYCSSINRLIERKRTCPVTVEAVGAKSGATESVDGCLVGVEQSDAVKTDQGCSNSGASGGDGFKHSCGDSGHHTQCPKGGEKEAAPANTQGSADANEDVEQATAATLEKEDSPVPQEVVVPLVIISPSVSKAATPVGSPHAPTVDPNSCKVCDVKCFSRLTFLKHCSTDDHIKRTKIHEFLNSEMFIIGKEPATTQSQFDSSPEAIIGLNEIYEMYHAPTGHRFWVCGVCCCGVPAASHMFGHVQGVKHKKRFIECRYPDRKERVCNKNEMADWLNRVARDIAGAEGKGTLKHALVVADIPDVLTSVGLNASQCAAENAEQPYVDIVPNATDSSTDCIIIEPTIARHGPQITTGNANSSTHSGAVLEKAFNLPVVNMDAKKQVPVGAPAQYLSTPIVTTTAAAPRAPKGDTNPKGNASQEKPVYVLAGPTTALQCETCWDILISEGTQANEVWQQHVSLPSHKRNRDTRKKYQFKPECFVNEAPSEKVLQALEQALKSPGVVIVGLHDIIETRVPCSRDSIDVVCLICASKFINVKFLAAHLSGKTHLTKYMIKYYPEAVAVKFKGFSNTTLSAIAMFLVEREARSGTVRVYDPNIAKVTGLVRYISEVIFSAAGAIPLSVGSTKFTEQKKAENEVKPPSSSNTVQKAAPAKTAAIDKETEGKFVSDAIKWITNRLTPNQPQDDSKGTPSPWKPDSKHSSPSKFADAKKPGPFALSNIGKTVTASASKSNTGNTAPAFAFSQAKATPAPEPNKTSSWSPAKTASTASANTSTANSTVPKTAEKPAVGSPPKASVPREHDISIKLLIGSAWEPIAIRYHAFAQPILDQCKEPLLGCEEVYEFCCHDPIYEPGYLCKLCECLCNCNDLIPHLTNPEHRLKYFEKYHASIYHSLTAGASLKQKSILQALAIKQHAQVLEKQEGRSRLARRLTIQVEPGPYGMKKRAVAAFASTASSPMPQSSSTPIQTQFGGLPITTATGSASRFSVSTRTCDILPPGVSLGDKLSSNQPSRAAAPYSAKVPPPPGVSEKDNLPGFTAIKTVKASLEQKAWSAQCDQFLAQLSRDKKNITSGSNDAKKPTAESSATAAKTNDAKKPEKTQDTNKKAESSRQDSSDRNSQRRKRTDRSRSRSRRRSRSRSRRSRSRRSRSRSRQTGKVEGSKAKKKSPSPSVKSGDKAKLKSPDGKPKPAAKNAKDVAKKRVSSPETPKKKPRVSQEEEKSAAKTSQQIELPEMLIRFTEQLVKSSAEKATAPSGVKQPVQNIRADNASTLMSLFNQLLDDRTKAAKDEKAKAAKEELARMAKEEKAKAAREATVKRSEAGLSQLLAMLGKGKSEPAKTPKAPSSSGEMEVLVKLLAEEEERQRRQEQQKNAIIALLSAAQKPASSGTAPAMVIDYGHGSGQRAGQATPFTKQRQGGDAADDLVKEAMRNVMKAQGGAQAGAPPIGPTARNATPVRPPMFPMDVSRPPPTVLTGPRPPPMPQQAIPPQQAAAMVNAAAAMLLSTLFNQAAPQRPN